MAALLVAAFSLHAQTSRTAQWRFGQNAGVSFPGGAASVAGAQINSPEGCASVAGPDGSLLFYTDGDFVWNRQNQLMPNGSGLFGNNDATQSALILPKPGDPFTYYIFHLRDCANGYGPLTYSVVDMRQNGGRGNVVQKNVALAPGLVGEKLTAVRNAQGNGYWVAAHGVNNRRFFAYRVTAAGVNETPLISVVGSIHDGADCGAQGQMKFSPTGDRIGLVSRSGLIEILDFNPTTGQFSNPILLTDELENGYGLTFSNDGNFLYVTQGYEDLSSRYFLHQFDVSVRDSAAIVSTQYVRPTSTPLGAMQLAPDGRIYIASNINGLDKLSVIDFPNQPRGAMNFKPAAFDLAGNTAFAGLPAFIETDFFFCSEPGNITVENRLTTTAWVTWEESNTAESYTLRYRRVGDTDWIYEETASTFILLDNLERDTEYILEIQSNCSNRRTSGFGAAVRFNTAENEPDPEPCEAPDSLQLVSDSDTTYRLSWQAAASALSYEVQYLERDSVNWRVDTANTNFLVISGLTPRRVYDFRVRSICADGTSGFSDTLTLEVEPAPDPIADCPEPGFDWALAGGGGGLDAAYGMATDTAGAIYLAGTVGDTLAFMGDTLFPPRQTGIFVAKVTRDAQLVWTQVVGATTGQNTATDVATDTAGNVYVTGFYQDQFTFAGDFLEGADDQSANMFVMKFGPDGTPLWAKTATGATARNVAGADVEVTPAGDVFVAGTYATEAEFTSTVTLAQPQGRGSFLAKYDTDGNLQFALPYAGVGLIDVNRLATTENGRVYLAGRFAGSFDPGSGTPLNDAGSGDAVVITLDSDGNYLRADQFGGPDSESFDAITASQTGLMYLAGRFSNDLAFGDLPDLEADAAGDSLGFFLLKLNSVGEPVAASSGTLTQGAGFEEDFRFTSIELSDSAIFAAGGFSGKLRFGFYEVGNRSMSGGASFESDGFVGRWNLDLEPQWLRNVGGEGTDRINALALSPNQLPYLAGEIENNAYFGDSTLAVMGGRDLFFAKMGCQKDYCTPPFDLRLEYLYDTVARVNWDYGYLTSSYVVEYRSEDDTNNIMTQFVETNFVVIEDLKPGTFYQVRVKGDCGDRMSAESDYLNFTTPGDRPRDCAAPPIINATKVGIDRADINFEFVPGVFRYLVEYRAIGMFEWQSYETDTSVSTVTGLDDNTTYQFRVRSICDGYASRTASPFGYFTTFADFRCPPPNDISFEEITGNTATLTWTFMDSAFTYQVEYRDFNSLDWRTLIVSTNRATLQGLETGTTYLVKIYSICRDNTRGQAGPGELFTTRETPDEVPQDCEGPLFADLSNITTTTVDVRWQPVDGAPQYRVEYFALGGSDWRGVETDLPFITLQGLSPATTYDVRVRAICDQNQQSSPSAISRFSTGSLALCQPPQNIVVPENGITMTSAAVSWELSGGARYEVFYENLDSPFPCSNCIVSTTNGFADLTGLSPATRYRVRVRAQCPDGQLTNYSLPVQFRTRESSTPVICPVPINLLAEPLDARTARVTWSAAQATGYELRFKRADDAQYCDACTLTASSNAYTLFALEPNTTYEVNVRSLCGQFLDSRWSSSVFFTTTDETAGPCLAPANLRFLDVSDDSALLEWDEAAGAKGYEVYWRPEGSDAWNSFLTVTNMYMIEGLLPETRYEVRLRTVCNDLLAPFYSAFAPTAVVETGVDPNACNTPANLAFVNLQPTSVRFDFDEVPNAEAYYLTLRNLETGDFRTQVADAPPIFFNDLEPGAGYVADVQANCGGTDFSERSSRVSFITPAGRIGASGAAALGALSLYPNPNNGAFRLAFEAEAALEVRLALFDAAGKAVWRDTRAVSAGANEIAVRADNLAAGIYLFEMNADGARQTVKVVVQ